MFRTEVDAEPRAPGATRVRATLWAPLRLRVGSLALTSCGGEPPVADGEAQRRDLARPTGQAMVRLPAAAPRGVLGASSRSSDALAEPPAPPVPVAEGPDEGVDVAVAPGDRGPREVPGGTSSAAARAFARLPVAIHDGPPVGAIGQSGIHVDRIWLGSKATKQGCEGKGDRFSITSGDQVNVCFRVVHGRSEEDVDVVWEKDGYVQRRRGVTIPALHAYRARAYLVLRGEYVGDWRVRIVSADGAEVAEARFTVVD